MWFLQQGGPDWPWGQRHFIKGELAEALLGLAVWITQGGGVLFDLSLIPNIYVSPSDSKGSTSTTLPISCERWWAS